MILDELAREVFSFLCHQDPSRTFQPGTEPLALCARCVGVYTGFVLALPVLLMAHQLPRKLAMYMHGAFVLQVIPFGFHLITHGLTVRTISGQLFALGVVYFLLRVIRPGKFRANPNRYPGRWLMRYLLGTALAVVLLQLLLRLPWAWTAALINTLALLGLGTFIGLAIASLAGFAGFIAGRSRAARHLP